MRIGLVQFSESYQGHQYLPYTAGLLQAYLMAHRPQKDQFLPLIFKREKLDLLVQKLASADIVGMSTYIWNLQLSLALARRLKEQNPDIFIIFGGPQVPDQAESFLREHPQVDIACHSEGEATLLALVNAFESQEPYEAIPGISYLKEDQFVHQPSQGRVRDLSDIPSPYQSNVFQKILKRNPDTKWIATWETNRGCPFSCSFCDWGIINSKVIRFDMERIEKDISWFGRNRIGMIYCADANFGLIKRDLEIADKIGQSYRDWGYPHAFHQQTAKNSAQRNIEVHKILKRYGVFSEATISLQSFNPEVLKNIRRQNIAQEDFLVLQRAFKQDGLLTYTDLILGLPGESYTSFAEGLSKLIDKGQHSRVQIFNAAILPNAEMAEANYRKEHGIQTVLVNSSPEDAEVQEQLETVIATQAMPPRDWRRARTLGWMAKFFYYLDRIAHLPLFVAMYFTPLRFHQLLELFSEGDLKAYPVLEALQHFFQNKALQLQKGEHIKLFIDDPIRGHIKVEIEEYVTHQLVRQGHCAQFYRELEEVLNQHLESLGHTLPPRILNQVIQFQQGLFYTGYAIAAEKSLYSIHDQHLNFTLEYNLMEVYQAHLEGYELELKKIPAQHYYKDWSGPPFALKHRQST